MTWPVASWLWNVSTHTHNTLWYCKEHRQCPPSKSAPNGTPPSTSNKLPCQSYRKNVQGFPCHHAINAIFTRRENAQIYAKSVFTIAEYTATYQAPIYPPISMSHNTPEFEDSELGLRWLARSAGDESDEERNEDTLTLFPPNVTIKPGRSPKCQIRGRTEVEPAKRIRCGNCKQFAGHNAQSCREPPAP
jgi:hypothetical protein